MTDVESQVVLSEVHDAQARVQSPERARQGWAAWLEAEARALVRHCGGVEGRTEIRSAMERAGVGDLLHVDLPLRPWWATSWRGFLVGFVAGGTAIGGAAALVIQQL